MQREIHQLRREVGEVRAREVKTRRGCLEIVQRLAELVTSLEASGVPAAPGFRGLLDQAGALFAPDATGA